MAEIAIVIGGLLLWLIATATYLLPTIVAVARKHPNKMAIILINIFLGWTFVGWLGALIWSVLAIDR